MRGCCQTDEDKCFLHHALPLLTPFSSPIITSSGPINRAAHHTHEHARKIKVVCTILMKLVEINYDHLSYRFRRMREENQMWCPIKGDDKGRYKCKVAKDSRNRRIGAGTDPRTRQRRHGESKMRKLTERWRLHHCTILCLNLGEKIFMVAVQYRYVNLNWCLHESKHKQ